MGVTGFTCIAAIPSSGGDLALPEKSLGSWAGKKSWVLLCNLIPNRPLTGIGPLGVGDPCPGLGTPALRHTHMHQHGQCNHSDFWKPFLKYA